MGTKIGCTIVKGPGNKKKIFVRNLPFTNNKFDSSKVSCKIKDKELKANECSSKIEFISDELGRGVEVRQKANTGAAVSLYVTENPDCSDIGLGDEAPEKAPTQDNSKVEQTVHDFFENEDCKAIGLSEYPFEEQIKNPKGPGCIPKPKDKPKIESKEPTSVVPEDCDEKTKADKDKKIFTLNKETNKCEEQSALDRCKAEGDKKDPKVKMKLDDHDKCVVENDTTSDEKACQEKNDKWMEKENEGRRGLKYKWNGKTCEDMKPSKKEANKKSEEDNADDDPAVAPKQPPGRFVPINNNFARPMWISPGAP
jgi:hypothetical protein